MIDTKPSLRPFNVRAVPSALKANSRWSPWVARWDVKRGKFDKIPYRGLSTKQPDSWLTYDAAVTIHERVHPSTAGVGYLMNPPHGVVGVDLDKHVQGGEITAEGWELIRMLDSYTEFSPTKGLHVLGLGALPADWTNHESGVEVYAGHEARFLTVTGAHVPGTPTELRPIPAEVLEELRARFGGRTIQAETPAADIPEILDDLLLPDLSALNIPYAARDFLLEGDTRGDRSRELHATAVSLYQCGLPDDEVLSILANSPHAMEVALDHRRQDPDRALLYLWREHCLKAKPKGELRRVASVDDFEDVSGAGGAGGAGDTVQDAMGKLGKPMRFAFHQAAAFSDQKPMEYLVKGVLPQAEICAVFGESGSGKTFWVLDLLLCVARGVDWRGRKVKQGAVAYVCAEGAGGFRTRLKAYAEYHDIDLAALPFHVLGDAPNLLERGDVRDLLTSLRALPDVPSVVCFDTWAQVTAGGNENSGEDMGRALGHCRALHRAIESTMVIVGHSGKDSDRGMRGWSGVKGALDAEIVVERSDQYRSATVTKLKDGAGEGDEFAFTLESVVLGQDADGENVTSMVVRPGQSVPAAQRKAAPKGEWQRVVLRVAGTLTDLDDAVSSNDLIEASVNEMPGPEHGKRDNRRRDAARALESLVAGNHISLANGIVKVLP